MRMHEKGKCDQKDSTSYLDIYVIAKQGGFLWAKHIFTWLFRGVK